MTEYYINLEHTYLQQQNQQKYISRDTHSIIESQLKNLGLSNFGLSTSIQQKNLQNNEEVENEELKSIFSEINLSKHIFDYGDQKLREQMNSQLIQKEIDLNSKLNIKEISTQLTNQKEVNQLINNMKIPEINGTFEEFSTQIYNQKTQIELIDQLHNEQLDFKNIEKISEDFIEDNKVELYSIYINKDKNSLQNILQVPYPDFEFTQKDKYTMLFPEDILLNQLEDSNRQEFSNQNTKKSFYTKLYFYLKLQKYEKCLENIFSLVSSPQKDFIYDAEVISKILKYIKRNTKSQELIYLIDIFDSSDFDQMDFLFEKYMKTIKEKKNLSIENLEETINQTSLIVFKSALNFKQLKENKKCLKINQNKVVIDNQDNIDKNQIFNFQQNLISDLKDNKCQLFQEQSDAFLNSQACQIGFSQIPSNKNPINLNNFEAIQLGNKYNNKQLIQSLTQNYKLQNTAEEVVQFGNENFNKNLIYSLINNKKEKDQQYISKTELDQKNQQDLVQHMLNSLLQKKTNNHERIKLIADKDYKQKDKLLEDNQIPLLFQNLVDKDTQKQAVQFQEEQQEDKHQINVVSEKEVEGGQGNLQNYCNQSKKIKDQQSDNLMKQNKCMLTLDGGGVKGIFQLFFLVALESMTSQLCDDIFYFIGGTSIGGIIALGLRMRIQAKDLLKIIIRHLDNNLFSQNKIKNYFNAFFDGRSMNPNSSLHKILKTSIFKDKRFSDIKKNTLITSAYLDSCQTIIPVCFVRFRNQPQGSQNGLNITGLYRVQKQFNNYQKPVKFVEEFQDVKFENTPLWQIAASTSAAFPYLNKFKFDFENKKNLQHEFVDGGYLLNNVDILLIEFLKQKDTNYNKMERLSQYYLLSISPQYGSINPNNPPIKETDTDENIKLPSNIFKAYINGLWDEIEKISHKNQNQSIFLTEQNKKNEKFQYERLQPLSSKDIELDNATVESLDHLLFTAHNYLTSNQINFFDILASLNQQTNVSQIKSQIENLEKIYPNDYQQLHQLIDRITIQRIKSEYKHFDQYYKKEGKQLETDLVDILLQTKIRNNKVQIKKMTDYKLIKIWNFFKNQNTVYYESKFKGVIQLAASVGSVRVIKKIFDILQSFNEDIEKYVITQFGDCKWNSLIAASVNQMVRTFIYLLMSIQDMQQRNSLHKNSGCQTFLQIKEKEKNKQLRDIIYTPCQEKYYYLTKYHTHYLEISNEKFQNLISWWLS
ncbi:hypothetical protein ABPG72_000569 [Tetrahymena utriculariae]